LRILRHFDDVPRELRGSVVAIGNFDGVHRGHRALIAEAGRQAKARNVPLAVLSFEPHPQEFFRPSPECFRLTPLRTKARLLAELGVDVLFALPFDGDMARRSPQDFVENILVKDLGISGVVVGHDFEFGQKRAGNLSTLTELGGTYGFSVTAFDTVTASGDDKISSTLIRQLLKQAKPEEAARLLGHPWTIEARVEHGDARGRTMGFPTANMHLHHCLAPAFGVYAVRVAILEGDHAVAHRDGVANFGIRPMYQVEVPLLETHLFDFDGDLYGKYLSVELIKYIRPEAKFPSLEDLIGQIRADAARAQEILAEMPPS
jgi:riboflavin kinase/FMN adenylyltransferase